MVRKGFRAEPTERLRQSSFLEEKEKPEEVRWTEHRRLPGEVTIKPKGEAYRGQGLEGRQKFNPDGWSCLEYWNGRVGVGAAAVWWATERVEPPWIGLVTGRKYAPSRREVGLTGRRYHLGKNKEVFDAELYTLYQAVEIFDEPKERDQSYTILSDSTAAIESSRSDEMGSGQRFAVAIIEVCSRLTSWGNALRLRWVPSHLGI